MHVVDQRGTLLARGLADHSGDLTVGHGAAPASARDLDQRAPLGSRLVAVRARARVRQNERAHERAMPPPERERDVSTHRQSGDDRALDAEHPQQHRDVVGVLIDAERPVPRALAESAKVRRDAPRAIHERAHLRRPQRAVVRKAVNERDRHARCRRRRSRSRRHRRGQSRPLLLLVERLHPAGVERHPEQRRRRLLPRLCRAPPRTPSRCTSRRVASRCSASTSTAACSAVGCGRAYAPPYRSCDTTTRSPRTARRCATGIPRDELARLLRRDEARATDSRRCAGRPARR